MKDKPSQARLKQDLPFEVAACWNGAVAMSAELFLWNQNASSSVNKRGWRMMDDGSFILQLSITYQVAKNPYPSATYPGSDFSPPVSLPLQFRGPSSEACDHSECFLLSYDLHRLYRLQRRPRIYMNPTVQVAYEANWYRWHTTVLRVPVVRLWLGELQWMAEKAARHAARTERCLHITGRFLESGTAPLARRLDL